MKGCLDSITEFVLAVAGLVLLVTLLPAEPTDPSSGSTSAPDPIDAPKATPSKNHHSHSICYQLSEAYKPEKVFRPVRYLLKKTSRFDHELEQVCDLYDYLNEGWTRVKDPRGTDIIPEADFLFEEKIGDCEDYAIALASSLGSIGFRTRIALEKQGSTGHAYTEVQLDYAYEDIADYLRNRYHLPYDHYFGHVITDTQLWLNLDWLMAEEIKTPYPGQFYRGDGKGMYYYPLRDTCIYFTYKN